MKKIIIGIFLITVITGASVFFYLSSRTVYNAEGTIGNTPGNLLNGGLFCEDEGKIYFSNPNDDGSLYVMNSDCTNFKKIHADKAAYINSAGGYLYYTRKNADRKKGTQASLIQDEDGVYRMKKNGTSLSQLYRDAANMTALYGNYIYYQASVSEGYQLFRVKINKTDRKLISKFSISPASIQNNTLYYAGKEQEHYIHSMNLSGTASHAVYEGNCDSVVVQGDYLYYLDLENNYAITRVDLNGSNPTVLVEQPCTFYNLSPSGKYIYYQLDIGEDNGLYRFNTETKESARLVSGYYNSIHVTNSHVFFRDFEKGVFYMVPTGDSDELTVFNPPVLKEK